MSGATHDSHTLCAQRITTMLMNFEHVSACGYGTRISPDLGRSASPSLADHQ